MNKIAFFVALSFVAASAIPQKAVVADSTVHSRDYRFSFANGNLLANWSFEDGFYAWEGSRHSKDEVAVLTGRNISPVSGSYVGVASGSHPIISAEVPVESGTDYSLSLYVANFGGGTEKPKISFYSSRDVFLSDSILPDFPASYEKWNFYSASIKVPATARFAKVVFENTGNGILLFDDVILEKGINPSDRSSVGMSIDFLDAFGRTHMKETLVHREKSDELINILKKLGKNINTNIFAILFGLQDSPYIIDFIKLLHISNKKFRKITSTEETEKNPSITIYRDKLIDLLSKDQNGNDVLMNEKDTKTVYGVIDRAEKIY